MLGDVGQQALVPACRGELALHGIVMNGWPGLLPLAPLGLAERAPPAVVTADPPRRPGCRQLARVTRFVDEEPVAELRVVAVRVDERVGSVSLRDLSVGDRGAATGSSGAATGSSTVGRV
jgi:hypothetical protein